MPYQTSPSGLISRDRITLRDYQRSVDIGAFHEERGAAQRLRFAVELHVAAEGRSAEDHVDDVLSYDMLIEAIDTVLNQERFDLLETLGERIAGRVLAHPRAQHVTIIIEKLDRGPFALGVEIARSKSAAPPDVARDVRSEAPWLVYLPASSLDDPRLAAWIGELAGFGPPLVVTVSPLPKRPEASGQARRHIDLLSQDQAAWLLGDRLPNCGVADSRTELFALLRSGSIAAWAPSRLILRAGDRDLVSPEDQAIWFAKEIGAARLFGLGTSFDGAERLDPNDILNLAKTPASIPAAE
ncbi:MAG: dihydroneopterin aldolase [Pseudomonadota bacterium]